MKKSLLCLLLTLSSIVAAQQTFFWPTSTPEEQGLSSAGINEAINLIVPGNYGQIRSLIIIKNGHMVADLYFNGSDGITPVYSVTKSIGSALLGIAQYQGYTLDIDRSMMDYMPEYSGIDDFENKRMITVADLLKQRHGLDWDEWSIPYGQPGNP